MSNQSVTVAAFKYANLLGKTPDGYVCQCGKSGVKLWREYQTMLDHQTLYCIQCAVDKANANRDAGKPEIVVPTSMEWESDSISWRVPAVPTEEGDTYWGHTSVPGPGVVWWRSLPGPDWTTDIIATDYEGWLRCRDMWKEYLGRDDANNDYYNKLLGETEAAITLIRKRAAELGIHLAA